MKDEPIHPIDANLEYKLHPDKDGYVERRLGFWGLSKREYFAAQAIQGLAFNVFTDSENTMKNVVNNSVKLADMLIEALEKK